jgi:hypothetical protein
MARRFHQTVYLLNQLSSDLDRWEAIPDQVNFINTKPAQIWIDGRLYLTR